MKYKIHYYENGKLLSQRGQWTYEAASKFLKRMGYTFCDKRTTWVKNIRETSTAEIVGSNGIPF